MYIYIIYICVCVCVYVCICTSLYIYIVSLCMGWHVSVPNFPEPVESLNKK